MKTFYDYIAAIKSSRGYKNIAKLEFLQPDGSVAFSVGSYKKSGYQKKHDTRAFLQDGTLNISLKNGLRRKATVKFANADEAFSYNINNIWFGKTVRLLMGIKFPDDDEVLFSQGIFVIQNPDATIEPNSKTITYDLSDKWVNLNGENGGTYDATYKIEVGTNIFTAMESLLRLSRYSFEYDGNKDNMFDNVPPRFTDYYNDKKYYDSTSGVYVNYVNSPYEIVTDSLNGNIADTLLELNNAIAGWIGYDANGALFVDASQDDISDANKPVMWTFTPDNCVFCGLSESAKTTEVKNDVIISGEDLDDHEIWGRASNYDDTSDTNINLIGKRTYRESKSTYWSAEQCVSLAQYELKKRSILQKSITVRCSPIFHLNENEVVAIMRSDKQGKPTERHLIQSITLPISETGEMEINATSVKDIPDFKITSSALGDITPVYITATVSNLGASNPANVVFTKDANFTVSGLGIEEVTINGNSFIKIPTLYRKITGLSDNQITSFTISNGKQDAGFKPYPVFIAENGYTLPYVLIGKYCSSSTSVMNSVDTTAATMSISNARINARALGAGYQLYDWQFQKMWQDLLIMIKETVNTNSGGGAWDYDDLGIYWASNAVWIDGIASSNGNIAVSYKPSKYANEATYNTDGYKGISYSLPTTTHYEVQSLGYDSENPFANYPKAVTYNGSWNTYYCDGYEYDSGSRPLFTIPGAGTAIYGAYYTRFNGTWNGTQKARLCYRPTA